MVGSRLQSGLWLCATLPVRDTVRQDELNFPVSGITASHLRRPKILRIDCYIGARSNQTTTLLVHPSSSRYDLCCHTRQKDIPSTRRIGCPYMDVIMKAPSCMLLAQVASNMSEYKSRYQTLHFNPRSKESAKQKHRLVLHQS